MEENAKSLYKILAIYIIYNSNNNYAFPFGQAKLHQRFLNIQQQINNLQTSPSKVGENQTIRNPNSSPIPLRSSVAQVVNATSKTEVQNSKVSKTKYYVLCSNILQ